MTGDPDGTDTAERDDAGGRFDEDPAEVVEELIDDLEAVAESDDARRKRRGVRRVARRIDRVAGRGGFGVDDLAQQLVGGFILSAPFVVTEEVWSLAASMSTLQWAITVFMVLAIGYGTLYRAEDRDADAELSFGGLPARYLSLICVSYGAVATLALVFDAPDTFGASTLVTVKAVCIGAVFSVVGAATADSIF